MKILKAVTMTMVTAIAFFWSFMRNPAVAITYGYKTIHRHRPLYLTRTLQWPRRTYNMHMAVRQEGGSLPLPFSRSTFPPLPPSASCLVRLNGPIRGLASSLLYKGSRALAIGRQNGCHISEPAHQRRARCFAAIFTVHIAPVNVKAHFVRGRAIEVGAQTQPNAVELAGGGRWAAW